jgi:DUF1365 family protein
MRLAPLLNLPSTMSRPVPMIGFGQIRHLRLRPVPNAFTYPGYFLRLPLRSLAACPHVGRWLRFNARGVFAVNDSDHGDGRPLLAWIDDLLRSEGINDAAGEVWLHTFPRVLGYVFNPVSFWFAHRADGALRAVVCEVNNTFGERHCYLLANADGRPLKYGEAVEARKAFHVSPFCRIEGRYRFRFMLTAATALHGERWVGRIDHDDDIGPLLLTSISGELTPATDRALARALIAYPTFTFGVMARIHWQALKLWLKRVPFIHKPEPPAPHVTR